MTTAAPPEKMMDPFREMSSTQIEVEARTLLAENKRLKEALASQPNPREAARRLSAPAPAAPRVGDDGLARLPTQAMYKAAMEAAMGGVGGTDDIVNAAWNAMQGIEQDRPMPPHPLSAPPAASDDEREELAQLIAGAGPAAFDDLSDTPEAWQRADRLLALGYRKRAARSDDEWKAIVAKWCADYDALALARAPLIDAARDAMSAFGNYIQYPQIRGENYCAEAMANAKRLELALSALPKGQDDEG